MAGAWPALVGGIEEAGISEPPTDMDSFFDAIDKIPMAYQKANAIFATPERKTPASRPEITIAT